jgi:hypothetical protein
MRYDFHPEARLEYRGAAAFYEARRSRLGAAFTREIEAAIERILEAPDRWRFIGALRPWSLRKVFSTHPLREAGEAPTPGSIPGKRRRKPNQERLGVRPPDGCWLKNGDTPWFMRCCATLGLAPCRSVGPSQAQSPRLPSSPRSARQTQAAQKLTCALAARNQGVKVRMKVMGPGVEHAQHRQLRAQPFGIAGQIPDLTKAEESGQGL